MAGHHLKSGRTSAPRWPQSVQVNRSLMWESRARQRAHRVGWSLKYAPSSADCRHAALPRQSRKWARMSPP